MTKLDKEFITKLSKLYLANGFGNILKKDIDIIIFDFFAKKIAKTFHDKNLFLQNAELNYMALNKYHIHEIALKLKLTDRRTLNYSAKSTNPLLFS